MKERIFDKHSILPNCRDARIVVRLVSRGDMSQPADTSALPPGCRLQVRLETSTLVISCETLTLGRTRWVTCRLVTCQHELW